jgi:hypothetical protein
MTTPLDKTSSAMTAADRQIGRLLLNIVLSASLIVTLFSIPVADGIHILSGLILLAGSCLHLVFRRRWIKQVILSAPTHPAPALRRQQRMFWGLCLSGLVCGLSGLAMIPLILIPQVILPLHCLLFPIHALSGFIFVTLNVVHHIRHRDWLRGGLARAFGHR